MHLPSSPRLGNEDETASTAPPIGNSGGDTLTDWVPYDHLYRALVTHVCRQLLLVFGPIYGVSILADVLARLTRTTSTENNDTLLTISRIRAGDLTALQDEVDFFDWDELAAEFNNFFVYVRHGEWSCRTPSGSHAEIEARLNHFRQVAADPSMKAAEISNFEWIVDTLAAGEARWAIDHGRPVAADDLAALAGVKPKTVANLVAAGQIPTDIDGRVPAAEALRYVERRKNFVRSTWQDPVPDSMPIAPAIVQPTLPEQVFVPVDADGNAFLPSLMRRSRDGSVHYAIGEKADPVYVKDYWQALDLLARMTVPRWRRPSASGKGGWGLVSAQDGWRRFARAGLERMVTATQSGREG